MAGIRTHAEMCAVALEHLDELAAVMPDLRAVLGDKKLRPAYFTGVVWVDWTHICDVAAQIKAWLTKTDNPVEKILWAPFIAFIDAMFPDGVNVEYEHWIPFMQRYAATLRSWSTTLSPQDHERVAFFLGMVGHEYQDLVFHESGAGSDEGPMTRAFAKYAWNDASIGDTDVETSLEVLNWQNSPRNKTVNVLDEFWDKLPAYFPQIAEIYRIMERPLSPSQLSETRTFVKLMWEIVHHYYWAILLYEHPADGSYDFAQKYRRGGLLNGASATRQGILRWYAQLRGWYYYQNEPRAPRFEGPVDNSITYTIDGVVERRYVPYKFATDASLIERVPGNNSGFEPLLDLTGEGAEARARGLLRFELNELPWSDNTLDNRSRLLFGNETIANATLQMYFAGRKTAQARNKVIEAFRVNRNWDEGDTQTNAVSGHEGAPAPGVTWKGDWKTPGCDAVPEDREAWAISSVTIAPNTPAGTWMAWDVTPAVDWWIRHPNENFGLLFRERDDSATGPGILQFYSSQASRSDLSEGVGDREARRPALLIKPAGSYVRDSAANPQWTDQYWGDEKYYGTIHTATFRDPGGAARALLIGRDANGVHTCARVSTPQGWQWTEIAPVLGLSDRSGYGHPEYYATLQLAVVPRAGSTPAQDDVYLLVRTAGGMAMWRLQVKLDPNGDIQSASWVDVIPIAQPEPVWADTNGWSDVKYYSTIQTAVLRQSGRFFLFGRGAGGVVTYEFLDGHWKAVTDAPLGLSDQEGWGAYRYYSTITTMIVTPPQGGEELWLVARGGNGIVSFRLNTAEHKWDTLTQQNPPWADPDWADSSCFQTIRAVSLFHGGICIPILIGRSHTALEVWRYDFQSRRFVLLNQEMLWSDGNGWLTGDEIPDQSYHTTIRTIVVGQGGRQELLMTVRRGNGVDTYRYDLRLNTWQQMTFSDPPWTDANGWRSPEYFRTIRALTFVEDDVDQVLLLARGAAGIYTYHLDFGPSRRWVGWGQPPTK